ncbi:hypothetical protein WA026_006673 [Henosepilachna vigintioctopunctata]|uniref:PEHE domain-containing protein n=1 Tax=Henosepilachna vigintioctopunctata TaxID=420089 RepID=A0AAW1UG02_9CUCU
MSEDFSNNHSAKYSNIVNAIDCYPQINTITKNSEVLHNPYDHFYPSSIPRCEIETHKQKLNCQPAESEVKFLKEWLLLHLDLIQQQNEEILSKERTILILQQENEMLKERISCMEQSIQLEVDNRLVAGTEETKFKEEEIVEDMTQGLGACDDNKGIIQFEVNCKDVDNAALNAEVQLHDTNISDSCDTKNFKNTISSLNTSLEQNELIFNSQIDATVKIESEGVSHQDSGVIYNFSSELDSMKTLRMSIRRKRVCSNSSSLSQNGFIVEEKKTFKRTRKRRKRSIKENQILTTPDLYVNQYGDPIPGILNEPEPDPEVSKAAVLEVPRWRVKVYASCYSMEGTENLDDEVFLRRHNRLEIDERRRKKWDVQRIREQRVIEKLKQRQERIDSHFKFDNSNGLGVPFWPMLDDIKFIEICDELAVSAFGVPIPKICPSEFILPWLNSSVSALKKEKPLIKRGIRRRKIKR